jgi:hypothetical protein
VESWKAIYGHPTRGKEIAPKGPFYEVFAAGFNSKCVGSERDPKKHAAMRKMLNPAFSQRGLLEQEEIISGIIDKFVHNLGEKSGPGTKGLNMRKWYEMNSFDILGEMAFGESFHSLDTGKSLGISSAWRDKTLTHANDRYPALLGRCCPRASLHDNLVGQFAAHWLAGQACWTAYSCLDHHQEPELEL